MRNFCLLLGRIFLSELGVFGLMFNQAEAIEIYPGSWFLDLFEVIGGYREEVLDFGCFVDKPFVKIDFRRNFK